MEDILDDPALSEVSPEAFRTFIRLLAMLNRVRSVDGKISLDRRGICFVTARNRVDYALISLRELESVGLIKFPEGDGDLRQVGARSDLGRSKVGPKYDLAVAKWPELQGSALHSYSYSYPYPKEKEADASTEPPEGSFGGEAEEPRSPDPKPSKPVKPVAFSEADPGDWIARMLPLTARSSEAERALWVKIKFLEIAAAARTEHAEADGKGSLRDRGIKIASQRWNVYLRERNPQRREFWREAELIANREATARLDSEIEARASPPANEPDPEDPLAMMRTGVNPYAN